MLTSLVSQVSINYLFYKRWPEVTKLLSKEALIDGYDFKIREDRNKIQEIQQVSLWSIGSWWSIEKTLQAAIISAAIFTFYVDSLIEQRLQQFSQRN